MFTIKMYDGMKTRILEAESFTILYNHADGTAPHSRRDWAEVTLHNRGEDVRYDIGDSPMRNGCGDIQCYQRGYIENSAGKTTEVLDFDALSQVA